MYLKLLLQVCFICLLPAMGLPSLCVCLQYYCKVNLNNVVSANISVFLSYMTTKPHIKLTWITFEPYTVPKILLKTSLHIESFVSDEIQPCCKTKVEYKLRQVLKMSGSDTTALNMEDIEKEREVFYDCSNDRIKPANTLIRH